MQLLIYFLKAFRVLTWGAVLSTSQYQHLLEEEMREERRMVLTVLLMQQVGSGRMEVNAEDWWPRWCPLLAGRSYQSLSLPVALCLLIRKHWWKHTQTMTVLCKRVRKDKFYLTCWVWGSVLPWVCAWRSQHCWADRKSQRTPGALHFLLWPEWMTMSLKENRRKVSFHCM